MAIFAGLMLAIFSGRYADALSGRDAAEAPRAALERVHDLPTAEDAFGPVSADARRSASDLLGADEILDPARSDQPSTGLNPWTWPLLAIGLVAAGAVLWARAPGVHAPAQRLALAAQARIPTRRATLVIVGAVAAAGFLLMDPAPPRWPLVAIALRGHISLGEWALPYRTLLLLCVLALAARWLLPERNASRSAEPAG